MEIGARVRVSQHSQFSTQRSAIGIGVISRISPQEDLPYTVSNHNTGYSNCYREEDLELVSDDPVGSEKKVKNRYPLFKKGQKVRIIDSTLSPSPKTVEFARRKRQGKICHRRYRIRNSRPVYDVIVSETGYLVGRITNRYSFYATDLEPWSKK